MTKSDDCVTLETTDQCSSWGIYPVLQPFALYAISVFGTCVFNPEMRLMMGGWAISRHNIGLSHDERRHSAWIYDEVCAEVLPDGVPFPNQTCRKREMPIDANDTSILDMCLSCWVSVPFRI